MKASNFSDALNVFILKHGVDGVPVAEICRTAESEIADGTDGPLTSRMTAEGCSTKSRDHFALANWCSAQCRKIGAAGRTQIIRRPKHMMTIRRRGRLGVYLDVYILGRRTSSPRGSRELP